MYHIVKNGQYASNNSELYRPKHFTSCKGDAKTYNLAQAQMHVNTRKGERIVRA